MQQAGDMHTFMTAAAPFAAAQHGRAATNAGTVANAFASYLGASNPMGVAHQIEVPANPNPNPYPYPYPSPSP